MSTLPMVLLITQSSIKKDEPEILRDLFEVGLERLHLRKTDAVAKEVAKLLEKLPEKYHNKIVLHRYPELLSDFDLAGYHYRSNEDLQGNVKGTTSRSFHYLEELKSNSESLDYCFFGPVYESISKKGYMPRVSMPELGATLHSNYKNEQRLHVYALGGVRRKKYLNYLISALMVLHYLGQFGEKKIQFLHLRNISMLNVALGVKKKKNNPCSKDCLLQNDRSHLFQFT